MVRRRQEPGKLPGDMADLLEELAGHSPAMEAVRADLTRLLALARERRRLPAFLIPGEKGTGQNLVAKLLHRHGPRAKGPLGGPNLAAIPELLPCGPLCG